MRSFVQNLAEQVEFGKSLLDPYKSHIVLGKLGADFLENRLLLCAARCSLSLSRIRFPFDGRRFLCCFAV